ncbi:hypothetical protein GCM10025857_11970 [Alicyclobacillus contaminans]|uniref:hypothetical protein n=1 Tax=Alicyclobacillus contaminans TaxID=392016 RepID=UPI0004013299|nr:hypothetical protein [Alicyclobacillus contaminans]GMA49840.1 hypothetical protein GCM10025857_11970 [Alicyclobacillus contaminans]
MEVRQTNVPLNLQIQNISACSGVFVSGQNVIYGWSAHSKLNAGLGTVESSNWLYQNISAVHDADVVDTPIDDRDVHLLRQSNHQPQLTNIGFRSLGVNTMQQNCGVFVGDSSNTGWDQHQKTNKGHGDIYGDGNKQAVNVHVNFDPDLLDTPVSDQDLKSGVFHRWG